MYNRLCLFYSRTWPIFLFDRFHLFTIWYSDRSVDNKGRILLLAVTSQNSNFVLLLSSFFISFFSLFFSSTKWPLPNEVKCSISWQANRLYASNQDIHITMIDNQNTRKTTTTSVLIMVTDIQFLSMEIWASTKCI